MTTAPVFTEEQQRVLGKAAKLQKLASGTSSREEANAALLKVQELLVEYDLSMADVEKAGATLVHESIEILTAIEGRKRAEWIADLVRCISDNFRCMSWVWTGHHPRWCLVGHKTDAHLALGVLKAALEHMDRESVKYIEKNPVSDAVAARYIDRHNGYGGWASREELIRAKMWVNREKKQAWLEGFVIGLRTAFEAQVNAMENTCQALILVKPADVMELYEKEVGKAKAPSTKSYYQEHMKATKAGYEAGKRYNAQPAAEMLPASTR